MHKRRFPQAAFATALLAAIGPAAAQDPTRNDADIATRVRDCRSMDDPTSRLACFDALASPESSAPPAQTVDRGRWVIDVQRDLMGGRDRVIVQQDAVQFTGGRDRPNFAFRCGVESGNRLEALYTPGIHIPRPKAGTRFSYRKIRHPASGFAVVGIAVGVRLQQGVIAEISVGVTGAANHAFAGQQAADFLTGKTLSRENIDQAAKLLSETTKCLADRYASAEYRANLIRIETTRALLALSS